MSRQPKIVLVTGIPRSGSTWAYNVARLTLKFLHGVDPHVATNELPKDLSKTPLLIKTHRLISKPQDSVVIHSTRNYQAAMKSWRLLNPHVTAEPPYLQYLDERWRPYADFSFHHRSLRDRQERILICWNVSRLLGQDDYGDAVNICNRVDKLREPKKGMDPVTFLQHRHRSRKQGSTG